jgi:hypothetical protein
MNSFLAERTTDEVTADFTIKDIIVGKSVLSGIATSGSLNYGTVMQIIPGVGFCVDNGHWPSILWRDLRLHLKEMPRKLSSQMEVIEHNGELIEIPTSVGLRRTDSACEYGMPGYPDYEFWEKQGIDAPFVAIYGIHYYPSNSMTSNEDISRLLHSKGMPVDGPGMRAWLRQMNSLVP